MNTKNMKNNKKNLNNNKKNNKAYNNYMTLKILNLAKI